MSNSNNFNVRFLFVLMAFLPLVGHGQFPSHRAGFSIAPAITKSFDPYLGANSPYEINQTIFIGGSIGFSMLHDFGSRLQLQTDLLFSIYNDRISYEVGQEIHPEHGFILDAEPRTTVAISEYQTLTIPVLVNYYLNDKNKWRMYISGGVKGHLFISSYYSQFIKGDTLETFDNNRVQVGVIGDSQHRTISLSAQMGFGFEHQKSKKSCLRIAPYFEYFVVNPYKNYPSYELMAAGVSFGLYWK